MATVTLGNNISGLGANPMYDAMVTLAFGGNFSTSMDGSSATTIFQQDVGSDIMQVKFHGTNLGQPGGIITSFEYGLGGSQDFVLSGINITSGAMSDAIAAAAMADYAPLEEIFEGTDLDADFSAAESGVFFSGLAGDDDVTLTSFDDFYGLDGGDDTVDLGAGNDLIIAFNAFGFTNSGTVTLDGGDGRDTLQLNYESAFTTNISVTIDLLKPTIDLGVGFDLVMTNVENVIGSSEKDKLLGSNDANSIDGGGGGDKITGRGGADTLTGSFDAKDVFIYKKADDSPFGDAHDVITNFEHKLDDIDLSALDPKGKLDHFNLVKGKLNDAGDLRIVEHKGEGDEPDFTIVEGTLDGKGKPDFQIELSGIDLNLNKGDFIL
jgi:Ca2+-binding RTX toxin-like protein